MATIGELTGKRKPTRKYIRSIPASSVGYLAEKYGFKRCNTVFNKGFRVGKYALSMPEAIKFHERNGG